MASRAAAGSAKSMSESRAEALQALLDSLAPGAEARGGEKLKPDQVRKISDRLGELLGEQAMPDVGQRNEKGELLNEEGLPIIDIVEPVPTNNGTSPLAAASTAYGEFDRDVIPLWALSAVEKARRRAERERLFDLLEEEERVQEAKEEEEDRERFKVELEKRKQAAEAEMDALKKAREMQKKMGKALLRNLAVARDREEQDKRDLEEREKQAREERKKLKPRKSVTFADLPPDHEYQPANSVPMPPPFDWGDVAPAKLQTGGKTSVLTKDQMDKGPVRMKVIERVPGTPRGPKSPPPRTQPDSDDESEPSSPVPADSDEGEIILSDRSDSDDYPPQHDDSDVSDYGIPEDNEPVEWDDEGYDFARHQREIALAYYEKRATVGAEALAAMRNHEHTEAENGWDQPVVPLEASLASSPPKPSASRFKSSRAPASSTLPSQSLGANIVPASQSSTLRSAVRLGKLEDGTLVGGEEGESDDEIDPAAKEMLEMLKKGEMVNIGPSSTADITHVSRYMSPPEQTTPTGDGLSSTHAMSLTPDNSGSSAASNTKPSKVSQFKMSLTEPSTLRSPSSPDSDLATPVNTIERSSPKVSSMAGIPISVPVKTSHVAIPSRNAPAKRSAQMPGMIVDSPSFPSPDVIASPSSPTNGISSSTPVFNSMIIESPSFLSPSSTAVGTPNAPSIPGTPSVASPVSASVLERRPVVATQVQESASATSRSAGSTPVERKKVSRFLAERS